MGEWTNPQEVADTKTYRKYKIMRLKPVLLFLILTFSISWGFEALIAITITQPEYLETGLHPLGMFAPAFSAILIQVFFDKGSPLFFKKEKILPNKSGVISIPITTAKSIGSKTT